jgi:hypothetical protein
LYDGIDNWLKGFLLVENSILQNNLIALESISPSQAQMIKTASMEGFDAELFQTKTQKMSARVTVSHSDKPIQLHSAYDPLKEASRWAEGLQIDQPINLIVFGVGLGYHLLYLLKHHLAKIRYLIVVEEDVRMMQMALSVTDFRPLFQREGTVFIVGESSEVAVEKMQEYRVDFILHNCKILNHNPSVQCNPSYYSSIRELFIKNLTHDEVNMRTNIENQGRSQFNVLMNLPSIIKGMALNDCRNLLVGYPAVVSAAGPSLNKNIDRLKELNDRAALFIVDTAQNTFQKHEIKPHFVVTGDPTPLNFSHFEKINSLGQSILAFHPEVYRQITEKFINHPHLLPLFDENSPLLDHLFNLNEYGKMERAMNVGHLAMNLALYMGCNPIILVGFDYAFPKTGGTTHAEEASVSRAMSEMETDGTIVIAGKEGKAMEESGKMMLVPGYYDDSVPTTVPFKLYIESLEKAVTNTSVEIIDATEGGAKFEGTTRMPLHETLDSKLSIDGVSTIIDQFRTKAIEPAYEDVMDKLLKGKDELHKGQQICQELNGMLQHWQQLLQQGPISSKDAQSLWKQFDDRWIEMCSLPLFDIFLGNAPQGVYFRRQRSEQPKENTGTAYIELMYNKYTGIIEDMDAILSNFIHCIELSYSSLQLRMDAYT